MKFDLTLYVALAFLVPGGLALCGLPLIFDFDIYQILIHDNLKTVHVFIFLSLAFFLGALIDSIRVVTIQRITVFFANFWYGTIIPKDYFSLVNKDTLPMYSLLLEKSFEYYRFNANCSVAIFLLTICSYIGNEDAHVRHLFIFGTFLAWSWITTRSQRDLASALNQFVKSVSIQNTNSN